MLVGLQPLPAPADTDLNNKAQRLGTIGIVIVVASGLLFTIAGWITADNAADRSEPATSAPELALDPDGVNDSPAAEPAESPATNEDDATESADAAQSRASIQVLDATGSNPSVLRAYIEDFETNGYTVAQRGTAFRTYTQTTVFYEEGFRDEATELARLWGFALVEPSLPTLNADVDFHVVLGADVLAGE